METFKHSIVGLLDCRTIPLRLSFKKLSSCAIQTRQNVSVRGGGGKSTPHLFEEPWPITYHAWFLHDNEDVQVARIPSNDCTSLVRRVVSGCCVLTEKSADQPEEKISEFGLDSWATRYSALARIVPLSGRGWVVDNHHAATGIFCTPRASAL